MQIFYYKKRVFNSRAPFWHARVLGRGIIRQNHKVVNQIWSTRGHGRNPNIGRNPIYPNIIISGPLPVKLPDKKNFQKNFIAPNDSSLNLTGRLLSYF